MLRLPSFEVARPSSLAEAIALLAQAGDDARVIAGGTDLVPNMKHELVTPRLLVSLAGIAELRGIRRAGDGALAIGATTTLAEVAASELVRTHAPALAQAASLVAGPQLRTMGTLGGNVMLDTRCQWFNQTYFWREALGFCLKKDGASCHVVAGGSKCVAAASNDTAPALWTLGAELAIAGAAGTRRVRLEDFYLADGIRNTKLGGAEVLCEVRVPATGPGHRGAYGKLRDRGSIDFPLLGVAARLELDDAGTVAGADLVLNALQARPVRVRRAAELLSGARVGDDAFEAAVSGVAEAAYRQCHPMPNIPGDHEYRREMIPVYVRRTLRAAARREGPVHHV